MSKKIITLLIVFCFLTLSINQCIANSNTLEDPPSLCYGFILSNVKMDNKSFENQVFCKIRHIVNDLLREEIPVYWTTTNITVNVSEINNDDIIYESLFEKGTFIIPFTGDNNIDTKIVTIICDYNQSSEIEENNNLRTPIYLLRELFTFKSIKLSKVKIANLLNFLTCGESWFSNIASKCGFLDFKLIENDDISKKLNNTAYNLLIWPGLDAYYPPYYPLLELFLDLHYKRNRAIRDFVGNGGGFVGSCYAPYMASRGIKPLFAYPAIVTYYPKLPSIGFLSISDMLCEYGKVITLGLEQQILNDDHPMTYGVESYLTGGFLIHGPKIVNVGENVNVIANFKNDSYLDGTPSIVSNKFGDGKVVLFSPHPEISDPDTAPKIWDEGASETYYGKKLITNAFIYATSKGEIEQVISESRILSFITEIWDETNDLSDLLNEQIDVFKELKIYITDSIEDVINITDRIYSILDTIKQIAIEQGIDLNEIKKALYYEGNEYLLYCFDLIQGYLKNTSMTIQTIEKIYPLLDEDIGFIEEIDKLKSDLSLKIDKIQETLSVSLTKLQKMEKILENYQYNESLQKINERIFKKTSHDIEIQTEYAFQQMPEGYFNSLKLLRHYWYNFETILAMN